MSLILAPKKSIGISVSSCLIVCPRQVEVYIKLENTKTITENLEQVSLLQVILGR